VAKYALLQLPGTALLIAILLFLRERLGLSGWTVLGITALWAAKDVCLFPFVWRAYETRSSARDPMVGEEAVAWGRLDPSGYVRVRGELWKARLVDSGQPLEKGEGALVTGRNGLTLLLKRRP
jgi:membrane-bound ClpP family serine protease